MRKQDHKYERVVALLKKHPDIDGPSLRERFGLPATGLEKIVRIARQRGDLPADFVTRQP